MNAFRTLVWLEWMKTSSKVYFLGMALLLGAILIIGGNKIGVGLPGQIGILGFLATIGVGAIGQMMFQLGRDFQSDQFQPLRLSPISPWVQLVARICYLLLIVVAYNFTLTILSYIAVGPFLSGHVSRLFVVMIIYAISLILGGFLPLITLVLLLAMIAATFRPRSKGRSLAIFVICIASAFWTIDLTSYGFKISGTWIEKIELPLPEAIMRSSSGSFLERLELKYSTGAGSTTQSFESDSSGLFLPIEARAPFFAEPILLGLMVAVAATILARRIWGEIEL